MCGLTDSDMIPINQANYSDSVDLFKQMMASMLLKLKSDARSLARKEPSEVGLMHFA